MIKFTDKFTDKFTTEFTALTPGIPDTFFCRDGTPFTREEIRVVALSKLRLTAKGVLWDVGAGTGSVAVEAARLAPQAKVLAIERRPERLELIEANRERFGLENLTVVPGEAPTALDGLPRPDRVFVGGSGGRLPEILQVLRAVLPPKGRLVLAAVTLDTLQEGLAVLKWPGWQGEIVSVTLARSTQLGGTRVMRGENPVFLITMERRTDT